MFLSVQHHHLFEAICVKFWPSTRGILYFEFPIDTLIILVSSSSCHSTCVQVMVVSFLEFPRRDPLAIQSEKFMWGSVSFTRVWCGWFETFWYDQILLVSLKFDCVLLDSSQFVFSKCQKCLWGNMFSLTFSYHMGLFLFVYLYLFLLHMTSLKKIAHVICCN